MFPKYPRHYWTKYQIFTGVLILWLQILFSDRFYQKCRCKCEYQNDNNCCKIYCQYGEHIAFQLIEHNILVVMKLRLSPQSILLYLVLWLAIRYNPTLDRSRNLLLRKLRGLFIVFKLISTYWWIGTFSRHHLNLFQLYFVFFSSIENKQTLSSLEVGASNQKWTIRSDCIYLFFQNRNKPRCTSDQILCLIFRKIIK